MNFGNGKSIHIKSFGCQMNKLDTVSMKDKSIGFNWPRQQHAKRAKRYGP